MAFSCQQQLRAPMAPSRSRSTTCKVVASTSGPKPSAMKASLAAAGAAVLLGAAPTPALAVPQHLLDPVATVAAEESAAGRYAENGPFTKLLNSFPNIFSPLKKINEDPFGADRAQSKTVADTKRPIAIPTEQEAVAPEAFPNPSELRFERPPVLAGAEGDEMLGANANQYKDLDASGRQALIDEKSPFTPKNN